MNFLLRNALAGRVQRWAASRGVEADLQELTELCMQRMALIPQPFRAAFQSLLVATALLPFYPKRPGAGMSALATVDRWVEVTATSAVLESRVRQAGSTT